MARARGIPHLTAPGVTAFGDWIVEDGIQAHPLDQLNAWDYARELQLTFQYELDREEALSVCELPAHAELVVVATCDCSDTLYRSSEIRPASANGVVTLTVPPGTVAKRLVLTRRLVVDDPGGGQAGPLSPWRGTTIDGHDDRVSLRLEGMGGQLPTEALSFSDTGRPGAPWQLNLNYEEPSDSFAGSLQLLLNIDEPAIRELATGVPSDRAQEAMRLLTWDVSSHLVRRATRDERLGVTNDWGDGTVGEALELVCTQVGLRSITHARRMEKLRPDEFEALLKAGLAVLR